MQSSLAAMEGQNRKNGAKMPSIMHTNDVLVYRGKVLGPQKVPKPYVYHYFFGFSPLFLKKVVVNVRFWHLLVDF